MPEGFAAGAAFSHPSGICTLFEGDYHLGLAAFLNSLVHAGYSGTVWAGYRGALPPWLDQLKTIGAEGVEFLVTDSVRLVFLPLTTEIHLTNYKPQFILDLLAGPASGCEYLWYFDPDICLRVPWPFFANWQRYGVALCQEIVNNSIPSNSPLRHQWIEIASSIGLSEPQEMNHYYNGGMVGRSGGACGFSAVMEAFDRTRGRNRLRSKRLYAGESGDAIPRQRSGCAEYCRYVL